jgi:hypothetical protein
VYAYSKDGDAPIVQWDCLGGANQEWIMKEQYHP